MYEARITPEALCIMSRVPDKVKHAAMAAIPGSLTDNPRRFGKPLVGELEGLWSARRGDNRIIYAISKDDRTVVIHLVWHRRDVYRPGSGNTSATRSSCLRRVMSYGRGIVWDLDLVKRVDVRMVAPSRRI